MPSKSTDNIKDNRRIKILCILTSIYAIIAIISATSDKSNNNNRSMCTFQTHKNHESWNKLYDFLKYSKWYSFGLKYTCKEVNMKEEEIRDLEHEKGKCSKEFEQKFDDHIN